MMIYCPAHKTFLLSEALLILYGQTIHLQSFLSLVKNILSPHCLAGIWNRWRVNRDDKTRPNILLIEVII